MKTGTWMAGNVINCCMKRYLVTLSLLFLLIGFSFGQTGKSINVYFLYGSRPALFHKNHEARYLGGKHGGHVTIGFDTLVIGFVPYKGFHVFAHRKHFKSTFRIEEIHQFLNDTFGSKYATFEIAVTDSQYGILTGVLTKYLNKNPPYDYAFLGMRCASATYDILSQMGIFEEKSRFSNIISNFYPKKLRRKMFSLAKINNYKVKTKKGRSSRKWEND